MKLTKFGSTRNRNIYKYSHFKNKLIWKITMFQVKPKNGKLKCLGALNLGAKNFSQKYLILK